MSSSFTFDDPDHFTAGTVGEPGHRVFFIQARRGTQLVTLKMEKCARSPPWPAWIAKTLEDLPSLGHLPDDDELEPEEFVEPAWAVGSLGGSYDIDIDRIVLVR